MSGSYVEITVEREKKQLLVPTIDLEIGTLIFSRLDSRLVNRVRRPLSRAFVFLLSNEAPSPPPGAKRNVKSRIAGWIRHLAKRPCLRAFSMQGRRAQGYRELGRSHQKSEGVHHRKMNLRYSITDPPGGCQQ